MRPGFPLHPRSVPLIVSPAANQNLQCCSWHATEPEEGLCVRDSDLPAAAPSRKIHGAKASLTTILSLLKSDMARTPLSPPSPCRKHRPFGYWRLRDSAPRSPPTRTAFSSPHIQAPLSSSSGVSSTTTRKSAHQPHARSRCHRQIRGLVSHARCSEQNNKNDDIRARKWRAYCTPIPDRGDPGRGVSSAEGGGASGCSCTRDCASNYAHLPKYHPSHGTLGWQRPAFYRLPTAQWLQGGPRAHAHAAGTPVPQGEE